MKRAYQRPIVCYQNFALSNQVSSGCEGIANSVEFQCSVYIPELGYAVFHSENICDYASPPGEDDLVCVHAPTDENNVYSS